MFVLKQVEGGTAVAEICRKVGIAEAKFYNWRKRYAERMPLDVKRLRQLEEDACKLKRVARQIDPEHAHALSHGNTVFEAKALWLG